MQSNKGRVLKVSTNAQVAGKLITVLYFLGVLGFLYFFPYLLGSNVTVGFKN